MSHDVPSTHRRRDTVALWQVQSVQIVQSEYIAMHCDILSIFVPKWGSYKKSFMYDYTSLWDFIAMTFLEQHAHQVLGLIVLCGSMWFLSQSQIVGTSYHER